MLYPKPPIVEALLDIQVVAKQGNGLLELDTIKTKIADKFPEAKLRHDFVANIIAGNGAESKVEQQNTPVGYIFTSESQDEVVQTTIHGFSFSKLKPYQSWESFIKGAKKYWKIYVEEFEPLEIKRVGLRYINRIEIPLQADYQEYIQTSPTVAPGLPQAVSEVFMRVALPDPETELTGVLTETIDASGVTATHYPFIVDIDVFKDVSVKPDADLTQIFSALRDYKNRIFENTITDEARGLFK